MLLLGWSHRYKISTVVPTIWLTISKYSQNQWILLRRLFSFIDTRIWLYIWVTRRVSYKKKELLTRRKYLSSFLDFGGVRVAHFLKFFVLSYNVSTFWVPCCDVHYDFRIKRVLGSSLPLGGGLMLSYVICVCFRIVVSNAYCVVFLFCFLRFVYPMLPVSLDSPFLIAPSIFSNFYFQ